MKFALCKGRHRFPNFCTGYIFEHRIDDVQNLTALYCQVAAALKDVKRVELYTSGLPVALAVVMDYCQHHNKQLILHHFDPTRKKYFEHRIGKKNNKNVGLQENYNRHTTTAKVNKKHAAEATSIVRADRKVGQYEKRNCYFQ